MSNSTLGGTLRHLGSLALAHDAGGPTDSQLLERYLGRRDEAAFEALVRRHGPMVLGVCRRLLPEPHDAEDAFQATFLVLVRKAASIARPHLLGNWLHGVAWRTAREARTLGARRRTRERQVTTMPEPEAPVAAAGHDLRPVLDEELRRLPENYRIAVVLCDLEGKSRREAARQLGWPEGTLSGRLARARQLLARRLTRRGLTLSAAGLATALAETAAPACVPAPLLDATVAAASCAAAGGALTSAMVSPRLLPLTNKVVRTMQLKVTLGTALVLTVCLLGLGTVLLGPPGGKGEGSPKEDTASPAREPGPANKAAPGKICVSVVFAPSIVEWLLQKVPPSTLLAIDPETGMGSKIADQVWNLRLSPDGKSLVLLRDKEWVLCDARGTSTPTKLAARDGRPIWSPDGKYVAGTSGKLKLPEDSRVTESWRVTADGKEEVKLPVPNTDFIEDWSPDGKWFLTCSDRHEPRGRGYQLYLISPDGKKEQRLTKDGLNCYGRFSPDGRRIVYLHSERGVSELRVMTVDGKEDKTVLQQQGQTQPDGACWSPDGNRLAVVLIERKKDARISPENESHRLEIMDADGKNRRELKLTDGNNRKVWRLGPPDWR
jgi:RNA polymerase sigma factor (sigma-70 family)